MNRTIKTAAKAAAITGIALIATATAANAATMDAGKGFVGKGEVQSAFGWKNETMQANQNGITFTVKQDASQALSSTANQTATQDGSQSASQTGTNVYSQTATQDVTETLTCNKNGAAVQNSRHGVRTAERSDTVTDTVYDTRSVTRNGDRDGSRTGSRTGTLAGSLVAAVDATNKKTGQYTGWFLNGYKTGDPQFVGAGDNKFNAPAFAEWADTDFGVWSFAGSDFVFPEYDFADPQFEAFDLTGEPTFGAWDTDNTNADPDVCVNNGTGITNFHRTLTEDPIVEGDVTSDFTEDEPDVDEVVPSTIHEDVPTFGTTKYGAVTSTGPAALFATYNNITKPLTITVPAV